MSARAWVPLATAMLLGGCSGHRHPPLGPPPEYEAPVVMPWDAGAPVDPLDNVKGEAVTDDDDEGQTDAGKPDGAAQLSLDAGVG